MHLLIKNVRIVHPLSTWHQQTVDILIEKGVVKTVGAKLQTKDRVFDACGACLSPGWVDIGTQVGDPGLEHREDFRTASAAAAAGGYTAIACLPNTHPAIHSKSEVNYVRNHARHNVVDLLPIGAVSVNCEGKDIAELYDMHAAGAVAFSDGKKQIQDSGLMLRALLYVQPFNGLVINQPLDKAMALNGQMHEGVVSTSLGLRGIPSLSEELMVQRDIYLAAYSGSRLHLLNLSCKKSVALVREAKAAGLKVSASVAAMNLACNDSALGEFDANCKVMPPLRSEEDIEALKVGLLDGTIDCITSNHTPLDAESKNLEFPFAEFGAIGLQTTYALARRAMPEQPDGFFVEKLALAPRRVLRLHQPAPEPGNPADFTIFQPGQQWTLTQSSIRSRSLNTPFIGEEFTGKVLATVRRELFFDATGLATDE